MLALFGFFSNLGLFSKIIISLSVFLIIFILYAFYQIYIRPQIRMAYYKKQGATTYYFPLIGAHKLGIDYQKTHKDSKYHYKIDARTNPSRFSCSNLGTDSIILLNDPALIKEYFLTPENYIKDPVFLELYAELLGKGLITSEGARWKKQRKILSNAFHFEFLRSIFPIIKNTIHQGLYELRNTSGKGVNLMDSYQNLTGQIIGKTFFGEGVTKVNFQGRPLTLGLDTLIGEIGKLSISIERYLLGAWIVKKGFFPRHKKIMDKIKLFRSACNKIVEDRKKSYLLAKQEDRIKDMLDLLLEYSGEEGKLSDEEIIDQFVSFFLAGMDSTGHVVTIATYYLHLYPQYKQRVLEEVNKHYHKDINIDELNKLEFTMAFIKEILRFITPVPGMLPRRALKDIKLLDITLRKGDLVDIEFFYNNFNAEHFEDPDTFNPDRWLNKEKNLNAYAFTPFSAGPRNCIGQHLALIELRVLLAEFLTMYDSKIQDGYELVMAQRFLYEPEKPILVDLVPKYTE